MSSFLSSPGAMKVLVIYDREFVEKAEGLAVADEAIVVNISKEEETIQCIQKENIDFVLTVPIGRYLTTIGSVNDILNLPGIGKKQAVYCTDKLLFHQKMKQNGVFQTQETSAVMESHDD